MQAMDQIQVCISTSFYIITYGKGNYYLERECLSPPEALQKLIFPLIEQTDAVNQANGPNLQDIAQRSFMELLRWFRVIILQDVVFIRDKFPGSSLWNHHIFRLPQFEEFATRLKIEAKHGDEPRMVSISRVLPHIASVFQEQYRNVQTTLDIHHQSHEVRFNNLDAKVQQSINEIQPVRQLLAALGNEGLEIHTHVRMPQIGEATAPLAQLSRPMSLSNRSTSVAVGLVNVSSVDPEVPQYHMQSWVQTVVQLWEEYDKGIASTVDQPRGPSIRMLDNRYGSQWRRLEGIRKPYWRRKFIWQEVIIASKDLGILPEEVAERMDRWRLLGQKSSISLKKLNDMLSAVTKNQGPSLWGVGHTELL